MACSLDNLPHTSPWIIPPWLLTVTIARQPPGLLVKLHAYMHSATMAKRPRPLSSLLGSLRDAVLADYNIGKARQWYGDRRRSFGRCARSYLAEKVPVIRWLPHYAPSWLVSDAVAGLTIGVLLVPQSLAYANIAKLPGAYGLLSSWLPMLIYLIMGTSKGRYHFQRFGICAAANKVAPDRCPNRPRCNQCPPHRRYHPQLPRSWIFGAGDSSCGDLPLWGVRHCCWALQARLSLELYLRSRPRWLRLCCWLDYLPPASPPFLCRRRSRPGHC